MKRISIVVLLAIAMAVSCVGVAYANFGPHGGYEADTDACAGCHRAHSSFSSVTWTDSYDTTHTALLVGNTSTISEFCYVCHGDDAPGASTNVVSGLFDSGPAGPDGTALGGDNGGVEVAYETNSTFNSSLNGGGFARMPDVNSTSGGIGNNPGGIGAWKTVTSTHNMDDGTSTDPMWGDAYASPATGTNLTCTDCHDPHGSSNYRLLKDEVNGNVVGGYGADGETPNPFVVSAEEGYPNTASGGASIGWLKHEAGALQMDAYKPNYTSTEYLFRDSDGTTQRSMSGWCAGCHERYIERASVYEYTSNEPADGSAPQVGSLMRHRHPVNITLAAGVGPARALEVEVVTSTLLPLERRPSDTDRTRVWDTSDYLGCLTCHFAHGTSADMTGWAEASYSYNTTTTYWMPELDDQDAGDSGVDPNKTSALLRTDNRGVCERCHNK